MLLLVEFAPLAAFLAGYVLFDIYVAIVALMATMPISLFLKYRLVGKIDKMLAWSTVFLYVFGGVSLALRDPVFLYWKPTALYWAMAIAFFVSEWIGEKPLVQRFLGLIGEIPIDRLSPQQIRVVNRVWTAFFVTVGALNIFVAYNFSEAFWVNFKVFGLTLLTLAFMSIQLFWIFNKLGSDPAEENAEN